MKIKFVTTFAIPIAAAGLLFFSNIYGAFDNNFKDIPTNRLLTAIEGIGYKLPITSD